MRWIFSIGVALLGGAFGNAAHADTIVELETPLGNMTFQLYDTAKQVTVANFLSYIENGSYNESFAHRLVPSFVLQGGGYYLNSSSQVAAVPTAAPITNEAGPFPQYSNVLGTLAMAKVGSDPNSATSQWFVNLGDNSTNLDVQNSGFTVFGSIISGMDVLQEFNQFQNYSGTPGTDLIVDASSVIGTPFNALPVTQMDSSGGLYANTLIYTTWVVVPEPSSMALLAVAGLGAFGLMGFRRFSRGAFARTLEGQAAG